MFLLRLPLLILPLTFAFLSNAAADGVKPKQAEVGPRPYYLIDKMADGPLKTELQQCKNGPFHTTDFSIGHRGASLQFPEHSKEGYLAAARMGAGIIECDVTFTKDRQLVCRHSQCDLQATTDILAHPDLAAKCSEPFSPADPSLGTKARAKCCTSDITLAEFKSLRAKMDGSNPKATTVEEFMKGTPDWRTELYGTDGTLMTHADSIRLIDSLGLKFIPEMKAPQVSMPFDGDYSRADFAKAIIADYRNAKIDPSRVYLQSFDLEDIRYWLKNDPDYGPRAVYLDSRYRGSNRINPADPDSFNPSMQELASEGLKFIAPPMWMLLDLDANGKIVPSAYAKAAKAAGLTIFTWTLERSGSLKKGGGWYYKSVKDAISREGDVMTVLDVLAKDVGVKGVFSDWAATTTYYANCRGID
ncbi:MAG: glycerophosphodiester phosphodiesterase [Alphaproteobacteria bacterium]|nr:MAG: glycerophosphodiester phosphodiesterase [Alphaproteobacteria bacterium]